MGNVRRCDITQLSGVNSHTGGDYACTHMAMPNRSSHFFFSSLVLKKSSKPLCPCLCVR